MATSSCHDWARAADCRRSIVRELSRRKLGQALAVAAATLASTVCCGENEQEGIPPELNVPGNFIAASEPDGSYRLNRLLAAEYLPGTGEAFLHFIVYEQTAPTFEDARRIAEREPLTVITPHAKLALTQFATRTWQVVWFRALTQEELSAYTGG